MLTGSYVKGKMGANSDIDIFFIWKRFNKKSIKVLQNYNPKLSACDKSDYSFYVETIMKDGIDMLEDGQLEGFYFLSGMHIPKFFNIIAKIQKKVSEI